MHKTCTNTHFHTSECISLLEQFIRNYLECELFGIALLGWRCTFLLEYCCTLVLENCDTPLLEQTDKLGVEQLHTAPGEHPHIALQGPGHTFPWVHSHTAGGEHCGNAVLVRICIAAWAHSHIVCVEHNHSVPWEQICRLAGELFSEQICTPALEHCGTFALWLVCRLAWELACKLAWQLACRFFGEPCGIRGLETEIKFKAWPTFLCDIYHPLVILLECFQPILSIFRVSDKTQYTPSSKYARNWSWTNFFNRFLLVNTIS